MDPPPPSLLESSWLCPARQSSGCQEEDDTVIVHLRFIYSMTYWPLDWEKFRQWQPEACQLMSLPRWPFSPPLSIPLSPTLQMQRWNKDICRLTGCSRSLPMQDWSSKKGLASDKQHRHHERVSWFICFLSFAPQPLTQHPRLKHQMLLLMLIHIRNGTVHTIDSYTLILPPLQYPLTDAWIHSWPALLLGTI